ncbi:MAG: pre-peptidase C-terminal domain-containing protein [Verrucomicrobiales bacterium]|nr:pre-peptidase C-terminal domain-containing protein [Verrucomicrobiales bacterium]
MSRTFLSAFPYTCQNVSAVSVGSICILLITLFPALTFAGAKNIEKVSPRCGQSGTVVEVEIFGVSLHDPKEVIFYKPGIRAFDFKLSEEQPRRRNFAHGGYLDMSISCKFEISPDCPPGQYPFRLRTATQLSDLATFHVSSLQSIEESPDKKNTPELAMTVNPGVTINGAIGYEHADCFRVPVKKGESLSVELQSVSVADRTYGDSTFDLALQILDGNGKKLASNDDNALRIQDPVISFLPEKDGEVIVVVKRSVDQIALTRYVLHIGNYRRPLVAYPAGGMAGSKEKIRLIGDVAGEYEEELPVPNTPGFFPYYGDTPTEMRMRSSDYPNILEETGNEETAVASLPSALNGIIDNSDDVDRFRVSAKKGEPLRVRAFAASIGSPIDPVLRILDSDGKVVLDADDAKLTDRDVFGVSYRSRGGRPDLIDPSEMWTPENDGEYVVEISDSSGAGGPTGVYRVEIERPRTVVQTVLKSFTFDWTESTRNTGLALPSGGRLVTNITLPEGQWQKMETPFDLVAHGLPDGVTMKGPRIDPKTVGRDRRGDDLWPVLFMAAHGTKPGGAVITLEAKPVDPSVKVETRCQENIPFLNHSGGDAMHFAMVDRYVMAVVDPAPFAIDMEKPKAVLVRGGDISIPVKLKRQNGFTGPVEYWVRFADQGIDPQPPATIEEGETESILRLSATSRAPLGDRPIAVIARSLVDEIPRSLGVGDLRNCTEIVDLTIAEPFLNLSCDPASVRRGESKSFPWKVTQKTPFTGKATINLLGLPKGVTLVGEPPKIDSSATEVIFEVKATGEALLGQAAGLECEIVLDLAGQQITQRSGSGILRIDPKLEGNL